MLFNFVDLAGRTMAGALINVCLVCNGPYSLNIIYLAISPDVLR